MVKVEHICLNKDRKDIKEENESSNIIKGLSFVEERITEMEKKLYYKERLVLI